MSDGNVFRPAWNTKKHDDNLPPENKITPLSCPKCGNGGFFDMHQVVKIETGTNVQYGGANVIPVCTNCGNVCKVEELVIAGTIVNSKTGVKITGTKH